MTYLIGINLFNMKNEKLLLLSFLFIASFVACDEEDTIDAQPPAVDFNYDPRPAIAGEEVQFYANPMEGSGDIVSWHWEFGDPDGTTSNKRNPTFTYAAKGDYEARLLVTNEAGNAAEVKRSVNVAPLPFPANVVWSVSNNTEVGTNDGSSAPVIGDDGTIFYVESRGGAESSVVAVTDKGESGEIKWASAFGGELPNSPSIGPDGNIYINAWIDDKAISKINAQDGSIMWSGGIGTDVSNCTPAIDSEGNLYHGSRLQSPNGGVYSWSPTGEKRWEITGVGAFYSAPVISADEATVYFLNTNDGQIWAVNTADGSQKWDAPVGLGSGTHGSSLALDADGTIYYTTNEYIAAVTDNGATGEVKWSADVKGAAQSGVVIGPNGDLYAGTTTGLVALNPEDGSVNWTYSVETEESVPAVDVHGNIYIGTTIGELHVVNPEGEELRVLELGTGIVNSPTIADDGTVYIEALSNSTIVLYKIAVADSGPADSFWPMKGRNVKSTSLAKD